MASTKTQQASIFERFHVRQLADQLRLNVLTNQVLYIEGPPGVGKTQVVNQIAAEMGRHAVCFMLSEMMPEDLGGIITADVDSGVAKRLVPDIVSRLWGAYTSTDQHDEAGNVTNPEERRPVLAFADEINNATAMMLSTCFKLLHEGVAGGYAVPPGTVFVAAGNDPATSNVAQDLPAPLYNRMTTVKFAGPSYEEFRQYGIINKFHPAVMGFLEMNPQYLIEEADFTATGAQPTPRSWEAVSDYLYVLDQLAEQGTPVDKVTRMYGIAGRVGEAPGKMMEASLKYADKLVPFADIVADPNNAYAPDDFIPAYMQCLAMSARLDTVPQAEKCITYVKRLPKEVMSVFVTTLMARPDSAMFIDAFDIDEDIEGANGFNARTNLGQSLNLNTGGQ